MYFKFKATDIFTNEIITYPEFECIYKLDSLSNFRFVVNNASFTGTLKNIVDDGIVVIDKNVDRESNLIYPFIDKVNTEDWMGTVSFDDMQDATFGSSLLGTYLVNKTVAKDYIENSNHSVINSLKNKWLFNRKNSEDFDFDSLAYPMSYHILPRELFGSGLKKGSVYAGITVASSTGSEGYTLAQDINFDGILKIVEDSTTSKSLIGQRVGYVFYDEGILLFHSAAVQVQDNELVRLTHGSWENFEWGSGSNNIFNWQFFGDNSMCHNNVYQQGYPFLKFKSIQKINNITMMCTAPAGKLNNSVNPSFLEVGQQYFLTQSSKTTFTENINLNIANIKSSSYNISELFEKQTYISDVYIYDEEKKLIGIAKLANPIRKRENDSFTFKLSYDLG